MKNDPLRDDREEIHNLDELIEARTPNPSSSDLDVPEDIDVDEALTFPHPHHAQPEEIDLMDTPHQENMDEDWADQDILPSDYAQAYNDATTTDPRDDVDEIAEDELRALGHPSLDQFSRETPIETMPGVFTPDEEA
jgi:hypothetical protein